jgi:hypothetical protein
VDRTIGAPTIKLVRLNLNGTVDPTFGTSNDGIASGPNFRMDSLTVGGDGSLAALTSGGLVRFGSNGSVDDAFGGSDGALPLADIGSRYDNEQPFGINPSLDPLQLDDDSRILLPAMKTSADGSANLGVGVLPRRHGYYRVRPRAEAAVHRGKCTVGYDHR